MSERNYTVNFNANANGLKKGTDEVINKLNELNKKLVDNQYKQRECNTVISDAQREFKKLIKDEENRKKKIEELNKKIEEAQKKIDELNKKKETEGKLTKEEEKELKALTSTVNKANKALGEMSRTQEEQAKFERDLYQKTKELTGSIEEEKLKLSQLKVEHASIKAVISETSKEISGNNKEWTVLKATLANLASDTLEKLGSKLLSIGKDIIQTGEQFSSSMSEVAAISGATAEELNRMEEAARLYGSTTKFSATEAADALKYMALAGWSAQQSIDGLPAVLDLAAASNMDLGRASDIVTDYITAFGLEVEDAAHFVDIMTYAQNNSNTTTEMLGEAYKNCAATAASMSFTVEEVTAALMTMANAGVKGGEAGTTLNTLMTRLATNAKNCADELGELGVEIYDSQGNMNSLSDILNKMIGAWADLTEKQKNNLSKVIAGTNQYSGFQTVMQGLSDKAVKAGMSFNDYSKALEDCDGTAKDAAKTMSNNLTGDLKALDSALDELKLKIYDDAEHPLRSFIQTITKYGVPALESYINVLDKMIPVVLAGAAAMASYKAALAVESIIKGVQQGLKALTVARGIETAAVKAETTATAELNTVQAANPIGLLVATLGMLTVGIIEYAAFASNAAEETSEWTKASNEARESAEKLTEGIDNLKKSRDEQITSAEGEAALLRTLQEEYNELTSITGRNAEQNERLEYIAERLAEKLNITTQDLKDQSGAYRDLNNQIDDHIKKLTEQAELSYYEDLITESGKAAAQSEKQMHDTKMQMQDTENEIQALKDKLKDFSAASKDINYGMSGSKVYSDIISQINELENKHKSLETSYSHFYVANMKATEALEDAKQGLRSYGQDADGLTSSVKTQTKTFSEEKEELDKLREAMQKAGEEAEKAKEDIDKAVSGALSNVQRSAQNLQKVQAEIKETKKVSLSTLSSIASAYPELNSLLNDYCNGLKNEGDIIKALEKVYKNDVDSYNQAVRQKEIMTDGYVKAAAKASSELVDKYKEHYGIDLRNFANAAEAKAEIEKNLYEKMAAAKEKYNALSDKYYTTVENGEQILMVKDKSAPDGVRRANVKEISDYNAVRSGYFKSQDDFYSFDIEEFQKQLAADVAKYYKDNSVSADDLLKGFTDTSTSKKSDKSSSEKSETKAKWTMNARNVYAEGDTYIKAYVNWIERVKNLGKLTVQEEISILQNLLARSENTADERYDIEYRLYKAKENLQKEQDEKQKQLEEAAQKRAKDAADALLERQKLALAAYNRLVSNKIDSLKAESDAAKESADKQIAALDAVMAKRKQEQEDAKRQKELDVIETKLEYRKNQLTEFEINDLYRRRQEILNEQAEATFERDIENRKAAITGTANSIQTKNDQAIAGLQASKTQLADRIAYLQGNQTYDQRVQNNSKTVNFTVIQSGLSNDQFAMQIVNRVKKELGV